MPQLENLKSLHNSLTKKRPLTITVLPQQLQTISSNLSTQHILFINKLDNFLNWWTSRRLNQHYIDRLAFLDEVTNKTQERVDTSYKSIEFLQRSVILKKEEITSIKKMNDELAKSIIQRKNDKEKLSNELEILKKSFVPLPETISNELNELRLEYQNAQNKSKSLDIEYLLYNDSSTQDIEAENSLISSLKQYQIGLFQLVNIQDKVEKIKKENENKKISTRNIRQNNTINSDPRLLLSEDPNQFIVAAAPIDILCKLLFDPINNDILYSYSFLVLIHTEKLDISSLSRLILSSFESSPYSDIRNERLKKLLDVWNEWFEDDIRQIPQLVSLVSWTGVSHLTRTSENIIFDDRIPIDFQLDIPFCAHPFIIAQHFFNVELQIIKSIPASEFIGTGWSKVDKWTKTPNIVKLTEHFNTVSAYIVSSIINSNKIDQRVLLIEKWIYILESSKEIYDFLLMFEIFGALCNPAITRLTQTWEKISPDCKQIFKEIQSLTSPMKQFSTYRDLLKSISPKLSIPYIGPMLTQLVYIHDGNPSKKKLPGSNEEVLNFIKYRSYVEIMMEIMKPWGSETKARLNKKLLNRIKSLPIPEQSDSELYQMSLTLE